MTSPKRRISNLGFPLLAATVILAWIAPSAFGAGTAIAEEPAVAPDSELDELDELLELDFEDLLSMDIEVTSATRTEGVTLAEAPAALYVIGEDEIRRSGLSTIPDLLRLAPGLHVAQYTANSWGVGVRGTNSRYNRDLLVLRDGRTLYTPIFSGVNWEQQDTVLEDLSRIEVIRGPGGTLWGANAVNGVINITTKPAEDTQGFMLSTEVGNREQVGSFRYGGRIDEHTAWRVYGKGRWRDDGVNFGTGADANDEYRSFVGGYRFDHVPDDATRFTLQGEVNEVRTDQNSLWGAPPALGIVPNTNDVEGWGTHMIATWSRRLGDDRMLTVKGYVDHYDRSEQWVDSALTTVDLEAKYTFPAGEDHLLNVGASVRFQADEVRPTPVKSTTERRRNDLLASVFVQDTWTINDSLTVFLGTKIGRNDYTGFEVQPSARFVWNIDDEQVLWGAVSRAVRVPSRAETNWTLVLATLPGPTPVAVVGSDDLNAEELTAFELGHRWSIGDRLSLDSTVYYNTYDELIPQTVGVFSNSASADAVGADLTINWSPVDTLGVVASYSFIEYDLDGNPNFGRPFARHLASVRGYLNVSDDVEVNAMLWYTDSLAVNNNGIRANDPVDPIIRVDANLVWRPAPGVELTAGVRNLLDDRQIETGFTTVQPVEIERAVYGRVRFEF